MWIGLATLKAENRIPTVKLIFLADAVLATCDGLDGIVDNVLNDPAAATSSRSRCSRRRPAAAIARAISGEIYQVRATPHGGAASSRV